MKRKALTALFLALTFVFACVGAQAAGLPWNDVSKWSPSFTGERAYKTPDQKVTKVADGIQFTGIGGERENYTYGFSEPLDFPGGDLTIEFTIKEGTEPEMLFSFALMDKPNWGSWYSNNDMTGFIFNVRPNDYVEFHVGQALDWPLNVLIEWPEYDENNVHKAIAVKDKRMKFEFKKTDKGYKLFVNGFEIKDFEEKCDEFFLNDVLPKGKAYLTVSGLNYTFDPELRSTLVIHNISTQKKSGTNTGGDKDSSKSTGGPDIDDTEDSSTGDESSQPGEDVSDDTSSETGSETGGLESEAGNVDNTESGGGNTVVIVIVAVAVVLLVAGGLVYFLVIKKKK